mmetsp:Transcript_18619/g.30617  ORF Transcript_18619/g.30617 Transcript_18619/m.30617 type:complete len:106 (+) Transcript_18619:159-476(+)|eukprot:CAMPEP_0184656360 /NCGR_PEP_ID=MMETSP0308-20130426/16445_1 /TAXON_ID=38269 /ORGANISM="Gloeochaete witrockiana, Strain SAG 46.84" /LENGTH=105 /DNA_ID=CAMNT_0027093453 /DNA_START=143 /DNA_END=460 /DNA_ORIENTATION=+
MFKLKKVPEPTGPSPSDKEEAVSSNTPELQIVFLLPDGSKASHQIKAVHTVEYLKLLIAENHGIPYSEQIVMLNGKPMADPLSLIDFPELVGKTTADIVVQRRQA